MRNNKHRKILGPKQPVSTYVPEYVKLGKEPIVYEGKSMGSTPPPITNKKVARQHPQPAQQNTRQVPQQIVTHSGTQAATQLTTQPTRVPSVGNRNWYEGTPEEEVRVSTQEFSYDEIPTPATGDSEEDELAILEPGEYGVLIRNQIVWSSTSLQEVESFIEKILFGSVQEYSDVSPNDIVLIKRIPFKVGVAAIDGRT